MRIIARKFLEDARTTHAKARAPLHHWYRVTRAAKWRNLIDARQSFPHADQVTVKSGRIVTIFNITNDFRLITAIHYNRQQVFTLQFITHAEYDQKHWKKTL
jgi:mRNA interferase HigB